MKRYPSFWLAALSTFFTLQACAADVEFMVTQRPPFLVMKADGTVSGTTIDPTLAALKKAGVSVSWIEMPALRVLARVKANNAKTCAVGWVKTPEREAFATFSKIISIDADWAGLANIDYQPGKVSVDDVLNNPKATVLIKSGFAYGGGELAEKLSAMKAVRMETTGDTILVFKMIAASRADISILSKDEINFMLTSSDSDRKNVHLIEFKNPPKGAVRRLMCSKLVDDEWINRFNAALPK